MAFQPCICVLRVHSTTLYLPLCLYTLGWLGTYSSIGTCGYVYSYSFGLVATHRCCLPSTFLLIIPIDASVIVHDVGYEMGAASHRDERSYECQFAGLSAWIVLAAELAQ